MNIRTGDVHLTIVQGGEGKGAAPAPPVPDAAAIARTARVVDLCAQWEIPEWEGLAYVARLEEFVGRPLDEEEADSLLARVCAIKDDCLDLQKMLAGTAVVIPADHTGMKHWRFDLDDEDCGPGEREMFLEEIETKRKARSA